MELEMGMDKDMETKEAAAADNSEDMDTMEQVEAAGTDGMTMGGRSQTQSHKNSGSHPYRRM